MIHPIVISNKNTILDKILNENVIITREIYRILDFDLYYVMRKRKYDRELKKEVSDEDVIRVIDNNDFIIDYFCENNNNIIDLSYDMVSRYVIVRKTFSSSQLHDLLQLPGILSDIIYTYLDVESVNPIPENVLPRFDDEDDE